ncbi:MAG: SusC/RagA family TonB-linked outer membrane protein [Gemmatimonadaceae bacterium]
MRFGHLRSVFALACAVAALATPALARAQQTGTITGQVVEKATQRPISDAQVSVVGTQRGARTGDDGTFRITGVPTGARQVRIIRIGYGSVLQPVTVTTGSVAMVPIGISVAAVALDQVVTTATGEVERKRQQGTAVATLEPTVRELAAAQSPSQLLTGKIAGVDIASSGGTVGSGSRIRIRGANSISLSNEPLIIIDGVRFNNSVGADNTSGASSLGVGGQVPSRFNDINPEDIASIQVLKGPAAAAQYGTAAASGVIQITTKRGVNAKPRWTVYAEGGTIQDETTYPANFAQIGLTTAGKRTTSCTLDSQTRSLCTPNADSLVSFNPLVQASPFINGHRGAFGASVNGGNDLVNYYLSGNFDKQQGVFEVSQDQRAGGRANLSAQPLRNLSVQLGSSYLADHLRLPQNDNNLLGIISTGLLGRAFDDSAARGYLGTQIPQQIYAIRTRQDVQRFENTINSTYQPLGWLTATGVFGLDYLNRYDNEVTPPNMVNLGSNPDGNRTSNPYQIFNYTANGTLAGVWNATDKLKFTTRAGAQFNKELVRGTRAFGAKLVAGTASLSGTTARFSVGETNTDNKTIGELFSEDIAIADRIFFTGALRSDQNSAFGQNFGRITYPSASASWVVSDESFFPKTTLLNSLRLRGAIGESGRQPNFRDAITFFNAQTVSLNGTDVAGIVVGGTGNPNLRPERSKETEFGFDAGFFDQRLSLEVTHYFKYTTDLLVAVPLPPSLGLTTTQFQNLGSVRNRGWEYQANATLFDSRPVKFNLTATTSSQDNILLGLGSLPSGKPIPSIVVNTQQKHATGYPLGAYFQPSITYKDANGDGIIARSEVTLSDTAVYLGNPLPKTQWSLSPSLTLFQWFRVSALFDHKGGYKLFNNTARFRCSFGNCQAAFDPHASLADQAASIAIPLGSDAGYIENADFTKLRELSFTLLASDRIARAFRVHGLDLTIAGRNLHTWTNYKGFDPEVNSSPGANFSTSDFLTLPPSRTWTARVNVTF